MEDNYGFPTGLGTPVVMDTTKNVTFVNPNSPFGGLAQPAAMQDPVVYAAVSIGGLIVGMAVQYLICCQASKRCR